MNTRMPLQAKTVLFIAPRFFGYDNAIQNELKLLGATVDRLYDRPYDTPAMTAATKIAPGVIAKIATPAYRQQLAMFGRASYDYILVVNGQTLARPFLQELRRTFPTACVVLYIWDSLKNRKSILRNLECSDMCLSFDPVDATTYGLRLRPLFFTHDFEREASTESENEYDISFVGTAHTDRSSIVHQIDESLPASARRYWYLFLQAPWVFHYRKLLNPSYRQYSMTDFNFTPLPKPQLSNIFFTSSAILDIEHPNQTGLTIRTFETIGAQRKLVTTNSSIADYDFYSPANIRIIDRKNPVIQDAEFLVSPYTPIDSGLYRKYSIAGWVTDTLKL